MNSTQMILRIKLIKKISILEAELRDLVRKDLSYLNDSEKTKHYIQEEKLRFTIKTLKEL